MPDPRGPERRHGCRVLAFVATALLAPCVGLGWFGYYVGGERWPTIPGPEGPALLEALGGTLTWTDGGGGRIGCMDLSTGASRWVAVERPAAACSGPDARGRIAYLSLEDDAYGIRLVSLADGGEVEVARRGERIHGRSHLALSDDGARIALESQRDAGGYADGPVHLDVLDLASGALTRLGTGDRHDECPPVWFPDGAHLAYCAAREDLPAREDFGELAPGALWYARIRVLDVTSGAGRDVALGHAPVVSPDGRFLYFERDHVIQRHDVADGTTEPLPGCAPGQLRSGALIACLEGERLLYHALPTRGAPQLRRVGAFALDDPDYRWTLEVGSTGSPGFATLEPSWARLATWFSRSRLPGAERAPVTR